MAQQQSYHLVSSSERGQNETPTRERSQGRRDEENTAAPLIQISSYSDQKEINEYLTIIANFLVYLLPTFVQKWYFPHAFPRRKLRKTSFLDGLRGVAALFIVIAHTVGDKPYWYSRPFSRGPFKEGENPQDYGSILQLPFIRLLYSAELCVPIFFVVSGYVLSFRCIQIIRGTLKRDFADTLFSSVFRRAFRLFVPSAIGLLLVQIQVYYGSVIGTAGPYDPFTIYGIFANWWHYMKVFFYLIMDIHHGETILMQFWTIPVEFTCSMVVFVTLVGVWGLKTQYRLAVMIILMVYFFCERENPFQCFIGGMFTAEVEEIFTDRALAIEASKNGASDVEHSLSGEPKKGFETRQHWQSPAARTIIDTLYYAFWIPLLFFAVVMLGWPPKGSEHDWMLSPFVRMGGSGYWIYWGALAYVNCLFRLPVLQKIYTTSAAQYLGDISYSIYIIHYSIGIHVRQTLIAQNDAWFGVAREGHFNRFLGNCWEVGVVLLIELPVADLFWRVVDIPSVKFAKWVEAKCRKPKPVREETRRLD